MMKPAASKTDLPFALKIGNGAFSGVVGTALVFPLDTIKSLMQASTKGVGIVSAARQALAEGGAGRLYRGLFPTLVMVAPEKAIKLGVNDAVRRSFSSDGTVTTAQGMIAGGVAGTVQGVITIPMELVKIRMQCAQEVAAPVTASERAAASLSARAGVAASHLLPQPAVLSSVEPTLALGQPSLHLSPRAHAPGHAARFAAFVASAPAAVGADPAVHTAGAVPAAARHRVFGAPAPHAGIPGAAPAMRPSVGPSLPLGGMLGPQPMAQPSLAFSSVTASRARLPPSTAAAILPRGTAFSQAIASLRRGVRVGAEVVRADGWLGLYRAVAPSLLRDVPFGLAFFPAHGAFSSYLRRKTSLGTFGSTLVSGVTVGAITAAAVTPADVIKTRLQLPGGFERYGTTANAFRTVVQEEGAAALMRGALPRAIVLAPTFGLSMGVYEVVRDLYARTA